MIQPGRNVTTFWNKNTCGVVDSRKNPLQRRGSFKRERPLKKCLTKYIFKSKFYEKTV